MAFSGPGQNGGPPPPREGGLLLPPGVGINGAGEEGGTETLRIEMLGAGQEVGRSCCVLSYKGEKPTKRLD